jgi:hypothetical protein
VRRITGILREDLFTFMDNMLLGIINVSDKYFRENQNRILCSIAFSRKSCPLRYNVEKYVRRRETT